MTTTARLLALVLVLVLVAGVPPVSADESVPEVRASVRHDTSPPLRDMTARAGLDSSANKSAATDGSTGGATVAFATRVPIATLSATEQPTLVFDGLGDSDNVALLGRDSLRADISGDVGPGHYVEWINWIFGIWDKQGTKLSGPIPGNALWSGFGGPCQSRNDGQANVIYDELADRWVLSQIATKTNQPSHQCVAVSATPDPLGAYHRYDFVVTSPGVVIDFPGLGLWPDAYYLTFNELGSQNTFQRVTAIAFERAPMLAGAQARSVKFSMLPAPGELGPFGIQPSHLDGPAPPAGAPSILIMAWDDQIWGSGAHHDGYRLWAFSVNWTNPGASSLVPLPQVDSSTDFDSTLCGFSLSAPALPCVPQRGTAQRLDTVSRYTMPRAQYRNFGGQSTLVVAHTIDAGGERAGVRWVELRNIGGGWALGQDGVQAPPDGLHRWLGSIAMNGDGIFCLSYSVSSATTFPAARYACEQASEIIAALGPEHQWAVSPKGQRDSGGRDGRYAPQSLCGSNRCFAGRTAGEESRAEGLRQACAGEFWLTGQIFVSQTLPDLFDTLIACVDP